MSKKILLSFLCATFLFGMIQTAGAERKFEGVTLKWLTFDSPHTSGSVKKMLEKLKEETGITLIIETAPHEYLYEKLAMAGAGHTGEWDLIMLDITYGPEFCRAGWVLNLTPYIKALGNKEPEIIGIDDYFPDFLSDFKWKEDLYGLPFYADCQLFVYREDILEDPAERAAFKKKYGYDYLPLIQKGELTQVQAYTQLAPFFTREKYKDPTLGVVHEKFYGTSFCRSRDACIMNEFLEILYSLGGDVIYGQPTGKMEIPPGKEYHPALDTDVAIEAARQLYYWSSRELNISPPGQTMHSFFELLSLLEQGKIAFMTAWSICGHDFRDPAVTLPKLVGKFKWAPGLIYTGYFNKKVNPKGGRSCAYGGWALGISRDTRNPDAAWEVLKFLCGKKHSKEMCIAGTEHPRYSIYGDPELQKMFPWYPAALITMPSARLWVALPEFPKILEVVVEQLNAIAAGAVDPEDGLAIAQKELYEVMKMSGYIK